MPPLCSVGWFLRVSRQGGSPDWFLRRERLIFFFFITLEQPRVEWLIGCCGQVGVVPGPESLADVPDLSPDSPEYPHWRDGHHDPGPGSQVRPHPPPPQAPPVQHTWIGELRGINEHSRRKSSLTMRCCAWPIAVVSRGCATLVAFD